MQSRGATWVTNIRGGAAGKSKKLPCPGVKFLKMIPYPGVKFTQTIPYPLVPSDKIVLCKEICTKPIEKCGKIAIQTILFIFAECKWAKTICRCQNDKYGPRHGADFYKNDTLSRSRNPENDTLFSGTSPYRKIYEYPPPRGAMKPYFGKQFYKGRICFKF